MDEQDDTARPEIRGVMKLDSWSEREPVTCIDAGWLGQVGQPHIR